MGRHFKPKKAFKKANRIPWKHTLREEVILKFEQELEQRISTELKKKFNPSGLIHRLADYRQEYPKIYATQKLKLLDEYEKAGRSIAFNEEPFQTLLQMKHS